MSLKTTVRGTLAALLIETSIHQFGRYRTLSKRKERKDRYLCTRHDLQY